MFRKITSIAAALATTATLAVAAGPAAADENVRPPVVDGAALESAGAQSPTVNQARPQVLVFKIGRFQLAK